MENMKICTKCSSKNLLESKYCKKCGENLENIEIGEKIKTYKSVNKKIFKEIFKLCGILFIVMFVISVFSFVLNFDELNLLLLLFYTGIIGFLIIGIMIFFKFFTLMNKVKGGTKFRAFLLFIILPLLIILLVFGSCGINYLIFYS